MPSQADGVTTLPEFRAIVDTMRDEDARPKYGKCPLQEWEKKEVCFQNRKRGARFRAPRLDFIRSF